MSAGTKVIHHHSQLCIGPLLLAVTPWDIGGKDYDKVVQRQDQP